MSKVEIKPVDSQGRIILPKEWRNKILTKNVVITVEDDRLEIRRADSDLTRFVDSVEVDSEDFNDYHNLRKGLRKNAVY